MKYEISWSFFTPWSNLSLSHKRIPRPHCLHRHSSQRVYPIAGRQWISPGSAQYCKTPCVHSKKKHPLNCTGTSHLIVPTNVRVSKNSWLSCVQAREWHHLQRLPNVSVSSLGLSTRHARNWCIIACMNWKTLHNINVWVWNIKYTRCASDKMALHSHTHTHAHMHTHMHSHMHASTHACIHTHARMHARMHTHTYKHTWHTCTPIH